MTFEELYLSNPKFHEFWYRAKAGEPTGKVLVLRGPSPSGKTTIARAMMDDLGSGVLLGPYPDLTKRTLEDLCIMNQLLILDNVVRINSRLVDPILQATKGIILARRALYHNTLVSVNMTCAIVLVTRQPELIRRADLLDRALVIDLSELTQLRSVG